jgi:DNA processing protein
MIKTVNFHIKELENMKKYPKNLYYIGNINLLKKNKISIVGSRTPNQYSCKIIRQLSNKLSQAGVCIVSGGALGIDTIAHKSAGLGNTIMVAGTGLDKKYPAINTKMIKKIEENGLIISQFEVGVKSFKYNFPLRNELIVALGNVLIVAYADKNSGTMRSIKYALKMGKKIYVLPHRLGESNGTNQLLKNKQASTIFDIDEFVNKFGDLQKENQDIDEFLEYCSANPTYDEAVLKYGTKVFEYELNGKISIQNGKIICN